MKDPIERLAMAMAENISVPIPEEQLIEAVRCVLEMLVEERGSLDREKLVEDAVYAGAWGQWSLKYALLALVDLAA